MSIVKRPALRYHGGKFGSHGSTADWIVSHLPPHRVYVEPFSGAASVLLRKPRSASEVINDLDEDVVNLFRVLRDRASASELRWVLKRTPYARREFELAREHTNHPIERARRLLVCSFMGHGSAGLRAKSRTGFRSSESEGRFLAAADWARYPDHITSFTDRLAGVTVECRDWQDVAARYDAPDTLVYLDPPYLAETRTSSATDGYRHEMNSEEEHRAIAEWCRSAKSMIVLSHYDHALYRDLYPGWERARKSVRVDSGAERTEVLWMNRAAVEGQPRNLFTAATGSERLRRLTA